MSQHLTYIYEYVSIMSLYATIGGEVLQLKAFRMSLNMTQKQLSELLGVKRSTVSMWEAGRSFPKTDMLPKLAKILNCTVDDLLKNVHSK